MATDDDMREQIRRLEERFDGLGKKVDRLPTRDELAGFKDEIIKNFRILAEDAKQSAKNAAEGYGGTLEKIGRDLAELKQDMVTKFSDHDKALANHSQRLATVERSQRGSRR